jgi:hypothetical protein
VKTLVNDINEIRKHGICENIGNIMRIELLYYMEDILFKIYLFSYSYPSGS